LYTSDWFINLTYGGFTRCIIFVSVINMIFIVKQVDTPSILTLIFLQYDAVIQNLDFEILKYIQRLYFEILEISETM